MCCSSQVEQTLSVRFLLFCPSFTGLLSRSPSFAKYNELFASWPNEFTAESLLMQGSAPQSGLCNTRLFETSVLWLEHTNLHLNKPSGKKSFFQLLCVAVHINRSAKSSFEVIDPIQVGTHQPQHEPTVCENACPCHSVLLMQTCVEACKSRFLK